MFSNINIARTDANGVEIDKIKVPLSYAPKDKMLARIIQDPGIDRPSAVTLPRMSFVISNPVYDGDRVLPKINRKVVAGTDANHMKVTYSPAAYDFPFSLFVYVKHSEDGTKIVEQILPFFKPDFTVSAHLVPEMGITLDIPVVLKNVSLEDRFEGDFANDRRMIIWQIDFVVKGYLFGPAFNKPIIKFVKVFQTIASSQEDAEENDIDPTSRLAVYPGLTANGEPTSNAEATIAVNLIEYDDDYGEITVINTNPFPANTYPFDRDDV
jgi:hypothetical protein